MIDWQAILDEIRHYAADIISLQEVETDQFYNFFKPELKIDGYEGIFSPKSRAKTMSENDRKFVDGCAIFFRSTRWVNDEIGCFQINNWPIVSPLSSAQIHLDQRTFSRI